jgi:CRISPR-associated protein Csm1
MSPEQQREYRTVVLGALLHDIGKYFQRGAFGGMVTGQHPQVGALFVGAGHEDFARCVDADLLRTLVQRHHESHHFPEALRVDGLTDPRTRALARLVSRADNLASSERAPRHPDSGYQPFRTTALAPIFDRIELTTDHSPAPRHFRQEPLTATRHEPPIFPVQGREADQAEVTGHIRAFGQQFARLRERLDWDNFDCVYTHFLSLLQSYAWCIPSDTQANPPDVSLYDHLRVTSAIAACLYRFHAVRGALTDEAIAGQDQTRCILLIGDLSGIQDYIFTISTTGAGGVAKRLRARSFFVQLLSDCTSLRVLRAFDLPLANQLMASGGKFYAVLPNLPGAVDILKGLQRDFDDWLLREVHGALAVNLAWMELPDSDFAFGRYGAALARLHGRLQQRKARRLASVLQDEHVWRQEFLREPFSGERLCLACRRFPATEFSQDRTEQAGADICDQCARQLRLGRRLTTAQFLSFFHGSEGEVSCLGLSASLADRPLPGAFLVVRLNNPDLEEVGRWPTAFRYLANHVPREADGSPREFTAIAGNGLLGVVKADVDYLGQIFQEGLRRDTTDSGLDTVSRLAALSRQLDWFFSGWLEWLLNAEFPDVYAIYSGGDDLLLVSPRAESLPLMKRVYEGFTAYAGHPEVTLSAGITLVKPHLPLAHSVQFADQALEYAKEGGRDRLCLLNQVVPWPQLPVVDEAVALLERARPPSSFLYQLLYFAGLWRRWKATGNPVALRFHPLLAYTISRNIAANSELYSWASRLVGFPLDNPEREEARIMDYLALIAQWVLLGRRVNRDADNE